MPNAEVLAERRFTPGAVEIRSAEDGGKRITGYGSVFNKVSRNLGGFVEIVTPAAFNKSRGDGFPAAVCRYNHDPNMLLGTIGGGTLTLGVDNLGLRYDVLPPQSRADIVELVERGDVKHSSFAFRVPKGGDDWGLTDQSYPMRALLSVELVDVAPVVDPAYPDATAALRSLAAFKQCPVEDVMALSRQGELRRFFVRTDGPVQPPGGKRRLSGAQAALALAERRFDPYDE